MENPEEVKKILEEMKKNNSSNDQSIREDQDSETQNTSSEEYQDDGLAALDLNTYSDEEKQVYQFTPQTIEEEEEDEGPPPVRRNANGPFSEKHKENQESQTKDGDNIENDPWSRIVTGLGRVTVTDEDREIFEDSFLTEDRIILPIKLKVGKSKEITVKCRTTYVYEREVIAVALNKIVSQHPVSENDYRSVSWDYLVRLNALCQIVSFDNKNWPCRDFMENRHKSAESDPNIQSFIDQAETYFNEFQGRKVAIISRALHIFEVKCAILEDALINQDFIRSADFD